VVRVDAVLTAVDTGRLLDDLGTDDLLVDRGVALAESDRRAVAEVLVRQVEYANVLIAALADGPGAGLLGHLNPHARRVDVASPDLLRTGLHDPSTAAGWVERGSVSAPLAETSGGVSTVVFTARRPFHPQRLYDSLRDLVEGVARSRGTVWLASRPAERLCWESAGPNLSMGALGPWLADLPPRRWDEVGPVHRARAALDWDEATGDRATTLAFTGVGLDPVGLRALLEQCLTAPGEWSGERAGSSFTDPFAEYLESAP
jgi:G3E family GTPase